MSDWAVGDLAVCIDDTQQCRVDGIGLTAAERRAALKFLVRGRSYQITRVVLHWSGKQGVFLSGQFVDHPYAADRFAKIRPDEHAPCEAEFVTLLNRSKRRVEA